MSGKPQSYDDGHYDDVPGARKESAVTIFNQFESELRERASSIFSMLPSNVSPEKFRNTAIAAVKKNPDLLRCTPRTLFSAITAAALDGLMPDGKEGIIQDRNVKISKRNEKDRWEVQATWQPMFHGFRKRARELDGLLVDAQVVYKNDLFKRIQGDDPKIVHEPTAPDQDPGPMIAAYAIFKRENGVILHREVMRKSEIEDTRNTSKQPEGLMWKTFTTEAWRKTVGRRGFKSVPVSENMAAILERDDRTNFEFEHAAPDASLIPPPAPPATPALTEEKTPTVPDVMPVTREKVSVQDHEPNPPPSLDRRTESPAEDPQFLPGDWQDYLDRMMDELAAAGANSSATQAVRDTVADAIDGANSRGEISASDVEIITAKWEEMADGS